MQRDQVRSPRRAGLFAVMLVLGGMALVFYSQGVLWWYAPLALLGVVLAHVAMVGSHVALLGAFVFLANKVRRGRRGSTHPHEHGSALLHSPRLFDWLAQVHMLGGERNLRRWMLDLAGLERGNGVLDVGCGTGTLLLAAAERVGPSGGLQGIEPSPEMAAHARRKAQARHIAVEVVEASAGSLPFPADAFDATFCTLVLHHLPMPMRDDAIREMHRVLRPGGRAVIIDWGRPKSLVRTITSGLFLVSLLHNLRPGASPPHMAGTESLMAEIGFEDITRHAFGGGVLIAVVGRTGSGAAPTTQDQRQDITRARSDADQ